MDSRTHVAVRACRARLESVTADAAPRSRRAILVGVAGAAIAAVLFGLARLGLDVPGARGAGEHGPLFVLGVFSTMIGLERAVALARPWGYGAPALGVVAALGLVARLGVAPWVAVASSACLVAVNVALVRRRAVAHTWLMVLGAALLAAGAFLWALGRPVFEVVPGWLAFFVLTIVAERIELSRLAPTPRWATRLVVALALLVAAAAAGTHFSASIAPRVLGGLFVALSVWEVRFDLARRLLRIPGLPRFAATGVLAGTGWLGLSGLVLLTHGLPPAGPHYDAAVHAVLVGFVLSMVFAHAPIILPAVARLELPFHPVLYAPLAVLHAGLVLRILGDVLGNVDLRRAGAVGNAATLALFFMAALLARSLARPRRASARSTTPRRAGSPRPRPRPRRSRRGGT